MFEVRAGYGALKKFRPIKSYFGVSTFLWSIILPLSFSRLSIGQSIDLFKIVPSFCSELSNAVIGYHPYVRSPAEGARSPDFCLTERSWSEVSRFCVTGTLRKVFKFLWSTIKPVKAGASFLDDSRSSRAQRRILIPSGHTHYRSTPKKATRNKSARQLTARLQSQFSESVAKTFTMIASLRGKSGGGKRSGNGRECRLPVRQGQGGRSELITQTRRPGHGAQAQQWFSSLKFEKTTPNNKIIASTSTSPETDPGTSDLYPFFKG